MTLDNILFFCCLNLSKTVKLASKTNCESYFCLKFIGYLAYYVYVYNIILCKCVNRYLDNKTHNSFICRYCKLYSFHIRNIILLFWIQFNTNSRKQFSKMLNILGKTNNKAKTNRKTTNMKSRNSMLKSESSELLSYMISKENCGISLYGICLL